MVYTNSFTSAKILVELIVVLVILAILAAILVPALLGWIDEARNKQYELEARSIYMAAQGVADKMYGVGNLTNADGEAVATLQAALNSRVEEVEELCDIDIDDDGFTVLGTEGTTGKEAFDITDMTVSFTSQNGNKIVAKQDATTDGWDITNNGLGSE